MGKSDSRNVGKERQKKRAEKANEEEEEPKTQWIGERRREGRLEVEQNQRLIVRRIID